MRKGKIEEKERAGRGCGKGRGNIKDNEISKTEIKVANDKGNKHVR